MSRPKRGHVQPLSADPARCYPSTADAACHGCARRRYGAPMPAEVRREPIVDASLFRIGGVCLMRIGAGSVPLQAEVAAA